MAARLSNGMARTSRASTTGQDGQAQLEVRLVADAKHGDGEAFGVGAERHVDDRLRLRNLDDDFVALHAPLAGFEHRHQDSLIAICEGLQDSVLQAVEGIGDDV